MYIYIYVCMYVCMYVYIQLTHVINSYRHTSSSTFFPPSHIPCFPLASFLSS